MKLLKYLLHLASRNLYVHLAVHLAWSPSSLMTNGRAPLLSTIPFSLLDHCWSYGTRWWERAESCDAPGKTRRQLKLTEPHWQSSCLWVANSHVKHPDCYLTVGGYHQDELQPFQVGIHHFQQHLAADRASKVDVHPRSGCLWSLPLMHRAPGGSGQDSW